MPIISNAPWVTDADDSRVARVIDLWYRVNIVNKLYILFYLGHLLGKHASIRHSNIDNKQNIFLIWDKNIIANVTLVDAVFSWFIWTNKKGGTYVKVCNEYSVNNFPGRVPTSSWMKTYFKSFSSLLISPFFFRFIFSFFFMLLASVWFLFCSYFFKKGSLIIIIFQLILHKLHIYALNTGSISLYKLCIHENCMYTCML